MRLRFVMLSLLFLAFSSNTAFGQSPPKEKTLLKAYLLTAANVGISTFVGVKLSQRNSKLGVPLIFYGALIAPSTGRVYFKDYKNAAIGTAVRSAAFAAFARALAKCISNCGQGENTLAGVAAGAFVGELIWNLGTLPRAEKRYRQKEVPITNTQLQRFRIGNQSATGLTTTLRF